MTTWTQWPLGRVVPLSDLVLGRTLSENRGQSRRVCLIENVHGWIYKEYRSDPVADEVRQLDRLVELPLQLGLSDKELVDRNTSWPAARVVDGARTVGVCLPLAPDTFSAELRAGGGRTRTDMLLIDLLAVTDTRLAKLGLPEQPLPNRVTVCSSIASVGALFERRGLAYLDWSYANAFWSVEELSAYVIDVDGCSFGARLQMETTGWADPLVPRSRMAGNDVDRFRVPLLVARCLTAERGDIGLVPGALEKLVNTAPAIAPVADHVIKAVTAASPAKRPPLTELSSTLTAVITELPAGTGAHIPSPSTSPDRSPDAGTSGTGVKGWKPVRGSRGPRTGAGVGPSQPSPSGHIPPKTTPPKPDTPSRPVPRSVPSPSEPVLVPPAGRTEATPAANWPRGVPPITPTPNPPGNGFAIFMTIVFLVAAVLIFVLLLL